MLVLSRLKMKTCDARGKTKKDGIIIPTQKRAKYQNAQAYHDDVGPKTMCSV